MNEKTIDQIEEEVLNYEVSDEAAHLRWHPRRRPSYSADPGDDCVGTDLRLVVPRYYADAERLRPARTGDPASATRRRRGTLPNSDGVTWMRRCCVGLHTGTILIVDGDGSVRVAV
jgi:hypothetical protein